MVDAATSPIPWSRSQSTMTEDIFFGKTVGAGVGLAKKESEKLFEYDETTGNQEKTPRYYGFKVAVGFMKELQAEKEQEFAWVTEKEEEITEKAPCQPADVIFGETPSVQEHIGAVGVAGEECKKFEHEEYTGSEEEETLGDYSFKVGPGFIEKQPAEEVIACVVEKREVTEEKALCQPAVAMENGSGAKHIQMSEKAEGRDAATSQQTFGEGISASYNHSRFNGQGPIGRAASPRVVAPKIQAFSAIFSLITGVEKAGQKAAETLAAYRSGNQ